MHLTHRPLKAKPPELTTQGGFIGSRDGVFAREYLTTLYTTRITRTTHSRG